MKKVLFVVDERKLGGVSIVLENILKNISRKKLDITVLVLHNNGDRLVNLPEDIKIIYGNSYFNTVDLDFSSLLKSKKIFKALKKLYVSLLIKSGKIEKYISLARSKMGLEQYDVEIAFKAGFCSLFVAYGNASYKINWVHEDYKTYNKTKRYENTFKTAFNAFDKHIIVSKESAKSFNNIYGMETKTLVINNYIDIEEIREKSKLESELTVIKDKLNVVTLGRFCNEKGFDRLIDAIYRLKEENSKKLDGLKIYILGYGEDECMLRNMIRGYNLAEYIQVINVKELENNPYAFMRLCDIYIMPSRSESFGMVRIEALLLGLPVITTNVANAKEMINSDIGIVVGNSLDGIYNGLEEILKDDTIILKFKKNLKTYSYDKENERIIKDIENLLEESCE